MVEVDGLRTERIRMESFYLNIVIGVIAFVLVVCWILLPLALIGTKPLLRELIEETRRTNALLERRLPDLRRRDAPESSTEHYISGIDRHLP